MDNVSLTINGETRSLIDTLNYLDDTDGSFTFTDLNDTPSDYTGQGGKLIAVKTTEDGTEFIDAPSGGNPSGDNLVDSVFGRVGSVVAQAGDYSADDITETVASKIMTAAERTKLSGIEARATGDQSDAEIEAAYNNQVGQVSAGEISAGTETGVRRFSPKNIADVARAHGGGAGGLRVPVAEDVDVAVIEEAADPLALLWEETRVLLVRLGVGQVDLLVGGVDITADDDGFAGLALGFRVLEHRFREAELVGNPAEIVAAVGKVTRVEEERAIIGDDEPALGVEPLFVQSAQDHGIRRNLRIEPDTRIALFLGGIDPGLVAVGLADLGIKLLRQRPGLLETEHIGLFCGEPVGKSLAPAGP